MRRFKLGRAGKTKQTLGFHASSQAMQGNRISGKLDPDKLGGVNDLIGIIAALMMSFIIGVQYNASDSQMLGPNFRHLMCNSQGFRTFIVDVMDGYKKDFNYTAPLGGGRFLDTKEYLLTGMSIKFNGADWLQCVRDKDVTTTYALLIEKFPKQMITVWMSQHPDDPTYTGYIEGISSVSFALLASSVVWSSFLHVSMSFLPESNQESNHAFQAWVVTGLPGIFLNFSLLAAGTGLLGVAHCRLVLSRSMIFSRAEKYVNHVAMFGMFTPLSCIVVILSVLSTLHGWWKRLPLQEQEHPKAAAWPE